VYHLSAWPSVLEAAYGYEPLYLACEDGEGRLTGVLPLVDMKGLVSGRRLNSLPLEGVAGPVGQTVSDELALLGAAVELCRERGAARLHFRSMTEGYERLLPAISALPQRPTWVVDLPDDPEALRGSWSRELRRQIRVGEAAGLEFHEGRTPRDLRRFHRLYLRTMRRHLAMPRSYRHLAMASRLLEPSGTFKVLLVERHGALLAGGVYHAFGDTVEAVYAGSDRRYWDLRPNHALFWYAMRWAIERGYRHFDFFGARTESLARFKRQWGAEPSSVFRYCYALEPGRDRVERLNRIQGDMQRSPRGLLGRGWTLVPARVTALVGTLAYRYL
jgi:Acetyltransferase (GNAT) domain